MTTPQTDVVIGGTELSTLTNAIAINQVASPTNLARADRFWASRAAQSDEDLVEALEINYASPNLTNQVSFEIVRFPHTVSIEYSPDNTNNWLPLNDSVTKRQLEVTILESYPPVLVDPSQILGHHHPQHDYDGHWTRYEATCQPTRIQKLRFLFKRIPNNVPVNALGNPVPYSVGLQNLDIGYIIQSENDIPFHQESVDSDTSGEVFANSADLFGSNLGFSKKTQSANNLLLNTDDSAPLIWKCEPQPFPEAVVNFYADLRNSKGQSQLINEIGIDPLYIGPSINLYYSNDQVEGDFLSGRKGIDSRILNLNGARIRNNGPLDLGTWHSVDDAGNPAYFDPWFVQVDNYHLGFDPSLDWWMGMEYTRVWPHEVDQGDHPLFSCNQIQAGLRYNSDTAKYVLYARTSSGTYVEITDFTSINEAAQIVVGISHGKLFIAAHQDDLTDYSEIDLLIPVSKTLPDRVIIGSDPGGLNFAGVSVTAFILSQSSHPSEVSFVSNDEFTGWIPTPGLFLDNPLSFSRVPLMAKDEKAGKYNALMRFDTTNLTSDNNTGFIGGPALPYDQMNWTPIPRTYEMQRGVMKLPLTRAKFWNLEVTNLRPEPNDKFVPVTRKVRTFPAELYQNTIPTTTATDRSSPDDIGSNLQQTLPSNYVDSPQYQGTGTNVVGYTPTEVYLADDYETREKLATAGTPWRFQRMHGEKRTVSFTKAGPHIYQERQVTQTSNISYFTGLRNITFSRSLNSVPVNSPVVNETFLDGANSYKGNWTQDNDSLLSGGSPGAVKVAATSNVIPTQTGLRGLQFATQQTDAKLIDVYGNFASVHYNPDDAAQWTSYGDGRNFGIFYNNNVGRNALFVSRSESHGHYADLEKMGTYADLAAYTYGQLSALRGSVLDSGGVQSVAITPPYGGQIYAAARVTSSTQLDAPLYVQIVDADSGNVLSETPSEVSRNEVKRFYTKLNLSDANARRLRTYGDLGGKATIWPSFNDSFVRAESSTPGRMDSGQVWQPHYTDVPLRITSTINPPAGSPTGSITLSGGGIASTTGRSTGSISLIGATNPRTWAVAVNSGDRSDINTQTPWGTLTVRLGYLPTTTDTMLLDLGGFFLTAAGNIYNENDSVPVGYLGETPVINKDYSFKFTLTNLVAANQQAADPYLFPYSIVISGPAGWMTTIPLTRPPTSVRGLTGPQSTAWAKFSWVPSGIEVSQGALITGPVLFNQNDYIKQDAQNAFYDSAASLTSYRYNRPVRPRDFQLYGTYTASASKYGVQFASLRPDLSWVNTPTGLATSTSASGGSFTGGTYYIKVTSLNAYGESAPTGSSSIAVANGGVVNVTWNTVTGATGYNVYRSTSAGGPFYLVGTADTSATYTDYGFDPDTAAPAPTYNTTNGGGSRMVTDINEDFGAMRFNVTQMPSGVPTVDVRVAYLDYAPDKGQILTLRGNGQIFNDVNNTVVSAAIFTITGGPITVYYGNTVLMGISNPPNPTSISIVQGTTLRATISLPGKTWQSKVRGLGGFNNGVSAGQYTIIEGFQWGPDGNRLGVAPKTYGQVSYKGSRTYGDMAYEGTTFANNIAMRVIQKGAAQNEWLVESAAFFWDPVIWEFSCDNGLTWWESTTIRNDPNGVLIFPYGLTAYDKLLWRATSYSGQVRLSHLAIRPWYVGQHGYQPPLPPSVGSGPNVVPSEDYAPIERDPRWLGWNKPVPHWWWDETLLTQD